VTASRRMTAIVLAFVLLGGLVACGGDDEGDDTQVTTETSASGEKTDGTDGSATTLKAALSGAEEVPVPGANPGVGAASVVVSATRVCSELNATMGEKPTMAHIHRGARGASGPVVVDLNPSFAPGESAFTSKGCVDAPAGVTAAIIADPAGHYVNIHSDAHPDGALRGQLAKL
jgi:hypothetical protein